MSSSTGKMPVVSLTAGNPTARAERGEIKAPKQPLEERALFPRPSPAETLCANPPRTGQCVCQHRAINAAKAVVSSWQYQLEF